MEMINPSLVAKIDSAIGFLFQLNRYLDRGMSLLSTRWKMLNCARVLHPKLAHATPALADSLSDFLDDRGCEVIYPATTIGDQEYENPIAFFEFIMDEFVKFDNQIEDIIDAAVAEGDHATKAFLDGFHMKWIPYVATMANIVDVAKSYGATPMGMQLFDVVIETCLKV